VSPSKLRKLAAYGEGCAAFHTAEVRDPTPNPYADTRFYDKREAWSLGWEEEKAECAERGKPPTPFAEAMARGDLSAALIFAHDIDSLKDVLAAVVERLERPL
jgi:hypothetical protein